MESSINPNRTIGIEIEVVVPIIGRGENLDVQSLIADVLSQQGMPAVARGYTRQRVPQSCRFTVEHDGSLRDESRYRGLSWSKIEAKTAPMTWDEIQLTLPPALDIIKYVGARCNASTGFHVHHHLPEIQERPQIARNLENLWWRFHPVMYGLVAPSRRTNSYCHPPAREAVERLGKVRSYQALNRELSRADRYDGLNLTNLRDEGRTTVEWRIHGGTTDWDKIKAWVLATQRWVEHAVARSCHYKPEPVENSQAGLNALLVTTGLKSNSRIYRKVKKDLREVGRFLLKRWKHLNPPDEEKALAA